MAKDSQEEAEAQLDKELQAHLKAKDEEAAAKRDHQTAKKQAKQGSLHKLQQHYLLTHTSFNSWWEATALLLFPALGWVLFSDGRLDGAPIALLVGLCLGFGYLVYVCENYGGVFARVFYAQEKSYLKRLPFPADSYWDLIGNRPSGDEARVLATLQFAPNTHPKKDLVEGTLRKFQEGFYGGASCKITWSEDRVTLKSHSLSTPYYGSKKPRLRTTGALHDWAKAFLRQVAEPLHKAYPLAQVSFSPQ